MDRFIRLEEERSQTSSMWSQGTDLDANVADITVNLEESEVADIISQQSLPKEANIETLKVCWFKREMSGISQK